ncbi:branched-chain amino acid ABC transporter permease [Castellaniella sp. MT123]|uniref:branched-chain amino acid ABC transporter permease n=1 Tax=Castellaniella sp. MT123 TaxID=3140381 RepID=UPI0031F3FF81
MTVTARHQGLSPSAITQAILLLVALTVPLWGGAYWIHVGALLWYYAILAASWTLLAGFAGQFSFAHLMFAALGGYASALIVLHLGMAWLPLAIVAGVVLAMVIGALIGFMVLRLSGPYLALFTLAISEVVRMILIAEESVTRGSLGLQVPRFFKGDSDIPYYYLGLGLLVAALVLMGYLLRTRTGLFLRAIREDEGATQASGVNTTRYKILVFVITSGIAAVAGIYYAHFIGILTPNMMILPEMGIIIAMSVIGGIESLPGAVVGAAIVYLLSELLRDYGEMRFVLLGLALILVQRFARNGLFSLVERPGKSRPGKRPQAQPGPTPEKSHAN